MQVIGHCEICGYVGIINIVAEGNYRCDACKESKRKRESQTEEERKAIKEYIENYAD